MGASRKLKKSMSKKPIIVFTPEENIDIKVPDDRDVITVTDNSIYQRISEGINQALASGRPGVIKKD